MINKELLDKINYLAQKQRSQGLTEEEKAEQQKLRQIYIKGIKDQIVNSFSDMGLKPSTSHKHTCSCGKCKCH